MGIINFLKNLFTSHKAESKEKLKNKNLDLGLPRESSHKRSLELEPPSRSFPFVQRTDLERIGRWEYPKHVKTPPPKKPMPNRCESNKCRTKLNIVNAFYCKYCKKWVCEKHRLPEKHKCPEPKFAEGLGRHRMVYQYKR